MKKIFGKALIFSLLVLGLSVFTPSLTFAKEPESNTNTGSDTTIGQCDTFLGMSSWDCGLNLEDIKSTDALKEGIWLIVANIANDATILAAYLVLGFILYGGYRYIFSGGDVGKVASGKKTLTTAFIGLGIVMTANIIFNAIKFALLKSGGTDEGGVFGLPNIEADLVFTNAVGWAIGIAGVVAAIFLVYGGVSYMTSSGDAGKLTKAKNTIIYALIGLAIVGLAEIIMAFVTQKIRESIADTQNNNQEIAFIKEGYEE